MNSAGLPTRTKVQRQVTKASITARHYTTVRLTVDTIPFRTKDNTSRIPRMLRGSLLRSRTTQTRSRLVLSLILPFESLQHVIKQGRGGRLLNTQNVGLKTPLDPHMNCSVQSSMEPRDPASQSRFTTLSM